jgi:hypothetical protein
VGDAGARSPFRIVSTDTGAILTIAILLILQDGPDRMAEEAKLFKYPFPYLYDEVWLWLQCAFS